MNLTYKTATLQDLDVLTEIRIEVLLAANQLPPDTDMREVKAQSRAYYQQALQNASHTAILVFDGDAFIAAGGVSYYQVMPTYHNPTGKKAYIMNMYTRPAYRRRGIARKTLDLLVQDARKKGITSISLEATAMGRPLYEQYGFRPLNGEMALPC